jgi:hypothetical protein
MTLKNPKKSYTGEPGLSTSGRRLEAAAVSVQEQE